MRDPTPLQCLVVVGIFLLGGITKAAWVLEADLTAKYTWAGFWLLLVGLAPVWFGVVIPQRSGRPPVLNPDKPKGPPPDIRQ